MRSARACTSTSGTPMPASSCLPRFPGRIRMRSTRASPIWRRTARKYWEVPYLPIDPADIGAAVRADHPHQQPVRQGRGGVRDAPAFRLHPPEADARGVRGRRAGGLRPRGPRAQGRGDLPHFPARIPLCARPVRPQSGTACSRKTKSWTASSFTLTACSSADGRDMQLSGRGQRPDRRVLQRAERRRHHGLPVCLLQRACGLDRRGIRRPFPYIELSCGDETVFGVGLDHNISLSSIKGILCAINRFERRAEKTKEQKE